MCDFFHNSSKRCRVVMVKQDLRILQVVNNNKGHPSKSQNWREKYRTIPPVLGQTHLVFSVNVSLNQSMDSWFNLIQSPFLYVFVIVGENSPFFSTNPRFGWWQLPVFPQFSPWLHGGEASHDQLEWTSDSQGPAMEGGSLLGWNLDQQQLGPTDFCSKNLGWNVEKHGEAVDWDDWRKFTWRILY